jgi:dipeptidyl aminopeptidase/acylaminoacyl peptidase
MEEMRWTDGSGNPVIGGLYLPPDYAAGKRYPLVIQTHGFDPHVFRIDGPYTTAFAAQPLAGKGIVVKKLNGL